MDNHTNNNILQYYRNYLESTSDARTKDWLLVLDSQSMFMFLMVYGISCYFLGPQIMKRRNPMTLTIAYIIYCFINVGMNAFTFYELLMGGWLRDYSFKCQPYDYSDEPRSRRVIFAMWYFYIIKLLEMLDSVFYVLWKKTHYASVYHYHHHIGMTVISWVNIKWFPGVHGTSVYVTNTFIHSLAYMNFGLGKIKKLLWLSKLVRFLTIVEIVMVSAHFSQVYFIDCGYPKLWMTFILVNMVPALFNAIVVYRKVSCIKKKLI